MRRGKAEGYDITPVLEFYGIEVPKSTQGWLTVRCPFHDDRNASGRVTLNEGGAFRCQGCDANGDAISLLMNRGEEGVSDFHSAVEFYTNQLGGSVPEVRGQLSRQRRRPLSDGPGDHTRGSTMVPTRVRRRALDGP